MDFSWNKFHPLFGADLKVGFKTLLPSSAVLENVGEYERRWLVHRNPQESVQLIYEPAFADISENSSRQSVVIFSPIAFPDALRRKLEFRRKNDRRTQLPRRWMVAGRHDEDFPFGFSSFFSEDSTYLSLSYPSVTGEFIPVYFKIEDKDGRFVYYKVTAHDDENRVCVSGIVCDEAEAPENLHDCKPGMAYSV